MMRLDESVTLVAAILHAAFMVRRYRRPGQQLLRAQALQKMGLAAREAFNASDNFEPLLYAIADGLYPFEADLHDSRRTR